MTYQLTSDEMEERPCHPFNPCIDHALDTFVTLCVTCIWSNIVQNICVKDCSMETKHHNDVIMSAMASQITGVSIIFSIVCSGADQRKHQISALMAWR